MYQPILGYRPATTTTSESNLLALVLLDATKDKFISPQPYASWALDSDDDWQPPTTRPDDDKKYYWDEDAYQADNSDGWVEIEL